MCRCNEEKNVKNWTKFCIYSQIWPVIPKAASRSSDGRASASHAGGRRVEPRREHFFSYQYYSAHGCKIQLCTPWYGRRRILTYTCTASVLKLRSSGLAATLNFLFLSVLLKTDDFSPSLHCKWLNGVKMRLSFILCVRQICTRIKFTYYLRGSEYAVIMRRFQI